MIILWVRKRKLEKSKDPSQHDHDTFRKHDEIMKKFRISHPDREVKIVTPKDIMTTGGNLLAPVDTVKLDKNKQN
jgi:hypothetical protein